MRSTSKFVHLIVFAVAAALMVFVGFGSRAAVEAAQATEAPTTAATAAATAAVMTYPPCPPAGIVGTASAATDAATMAATTPATPNATPAYLGVTAEQVDSCGVRVVSVTANSPASTAQLQADDVIVALDGQATPDINLLRDQIRAHVPGDKVTLTIERGTQQMDVAVTLGAVPADTTGTVEATSGAAAVEPATAAATPAATQ